MREQLATIKNMKKYYRSNIIAWSPITGEQYSANHRDYWAMKDDKCLKDSEGNDMILARKIKMIEPI